MKNIILALILLSFAIPVLTPAARADMTELQAQQGKGGKKPKPTPTPKPGPRDDGDGD